ncbi:MAG: ATP-dependent helicase HrpB [Parahaliea sp.]
MLSAIPDSLPVRHILPELADTLNMRHEVVLQAPPGAGKTTSVALALLAAPWLAGQTILLIEPRRIAARAAAVRMAKLLGENVGQRIGYRIRLESRVSAHTRIEVLTEGVLARRLQDDPELKGVALVIFDEFHERNLDSDLSLALCLQARELFRTPDNPLRLLVMSATLDGEAVAQLLDEAPVLTCEGRQYPVDIRYGTAHELRRPIVPVVTDTVVQAQREQRGSILVFLPGQSEIIRVAGQLKGRLDEDMDLCMLYGGLPLEKQQAAIAPAAPGRRKIVLATNIAETSLTIEGVEVVVDSGLMRSAVFDAATGVTRLHTRRISRASARQRAGRAGRLGPGICYRLWSQEQQQHLLAHTEAEILHSDLTSLALQLLGWGVSDITQLRWLDLPPERTYQQALEVLRYCQAITAGHQQTLRLTPHGVQLAQMPMHPRLGHMLLLGADLNVADSACLLAAVLSERVPKLGQHADLGSVLAQLRSDTQLPVQHQGWARRIREQARRFRHVLDKVWHRTDGSSDADPVLPVDDIPGVLMAAAYPDRIARQRSGGRGMIFQLSNGRSARLPMNDPLISEHWLAVAELGGRSGEAEDQIFSALPLNNRYFDTVLAPLISQREHIYWSDETNRMLAELKTCLGQIVLSSQSLPQIPQQTREKLLLELVRQRGLDILPWTDGLRQWRARVQLLYQQALQRGRGNQWPDLSDEALLANLESWLLPWLDQVQRQEDFKALDLRSILQAQLPWPLSMELARQAPEQITVPSGSSIAIDYTQSPPVLAVKLQEMFGCREGPRICDGTLALTLHLLSPARRPLQMTADLASFWQQGYAQVRKEMRGRYPKHPWPEDPLQAIPTAYTKARQQIQEGSV